MCGIIYAKNKVDNKSVSPLIAALYQNQKNRGNEGFGFVGLSKESINYYRTTKENDIISELFKGDYDEILFHHRQPTSTNNRLNASHPFLIKNKKANYYFLHNGIIDNAEQLFAKHLKAGQEYSSYDKSSKDFNDSESLGFEFVNWLENDKSSTIEAKGSVSLICLKTNKDNKALGLYFYTNGLSPLKILNCKELLIISSEGKFSDVKNNIVYCYNYKTKNIEKIGTLKIKSGYGNYNYGGYDYGNYNFSSYADDFEPKSKLKSTAEYIDFIDMADDDLLEYYNDMLNESLEFKDSDDEELYFIIQEAKKELKYRGLI